jgi:antitoxin component YwqK of YwqJK toxin-antitoxin module
MKKMVIVFSLTVLSFSSLFSQDGANVRDLNNFKQGFWRTKTNHAFIECHYLNDTLNGLYRRFFIDGRLAEECSYKKGFLDGDYKLFWKNGQLMVQIYYQNGLAEGIYNAYYENGLLWKTINYKNGTFNGKIFLYSKKGKKIFEANFANGILDGYFYDYFPNGQVHISSIFEDGKMLSGERVYNTAGKLVVLKLPNESRDRLTGLIEYDKNGKEKPRLKFINEKPITYYYFGQEAHKSGKLLPAGHE